MSGYNRAAGSAQLTIEAAIKVDPMVLRQSIGEAKGDGATIELALCCATGAVLVTVYRKSSSAPPRMYVLAAQAIVDAVLAVDDARAEDDPPPECTCTVGGPTAAPACPRHAPEAP